MTNDDQKHDAFLTVPRGISANIDAEAARHFSVYADQAKTNGYGFQSHLVTEKAIPQIDESLAAVEREQAAFDANTPQDVKDLIPKLWQWRKMAQIVSLTDEYDFIYTFTSKLLHATPASITTNQIGLEMPELLLFLKYINIKFIDIIELAGGYPKTAG